MNDHLGRWLHAQYDHDEEAARELTPAPLLDITVKRQLAELHGVMLIYPGHPHFSDAHLTREPMRLCRSCEPPRQFRRAESWPCETLKALAVPFAERPGYRDEWKPRFWFRAAEVDGVTVQVQPR